MSLSSQTSQSWGRDRHGSGTQDTPAAGDECWGEKSSGIKARDDRRGKDTISDTRSGKVTPEQRPEGGEPCEYPYAEAVPGQGSSRCQGPAVGGAWHRGAGLGERGEDWGAAGGGGRQVSWDPEAK